MARFQQTIGTKGTNDNSYIYNCTAAKHNHSITPSLIFKRSCRLGYTLTTEICWPANDNATAMPESQSADLAFTDRPLYVFGIVLE